ncbi:hypothetical protein R1sor_014108 [Riccia sorocarpa]|uniref:Uncharacterized protein n=1 Tax=Riccia sorocarpa TaxID=122646 RepID=A0ABD3HEL5_9MARC
MRLLYSSGCKLTADRSGSSTGRRTDIFFFMSTEPRIGLSSARGERSFFGGEVEEEKTRKLEVLLLENKKRREETKMSSPSLPGGVGLGFTKLSKGLAAVLVGGLIITKAFPFTIDYLALVPGKTIPFVWNLITAGYVEYTVIGLIVSITGLLFFGRLLEPVWGSKEFVKFIAFTNFFTTICTFIISIFFYYVTGHENLLYTPMSGFHGVLAGFLVAVKQIFPDYEINAAKVFKLRAKWLSSLLVFIALVVGFFLEDPIIYIPFIVFGTYGSWIYLRFFQRRSEANFKGDASDEFAFDTFFPEVFSPVVKPIAGVCGKVCCGKRAQDAEAQDSVYVLGGKPLPGSDPAEATRRRERGARALEERLSAVSKADSDTTSTVVALEPLGPEDSV